MSATKDILQGNPLRSPIHPALVHLPVALFPLALLLDLASWTFSGSTTGVVRAAYYSHLLGLGTAALAAPFGFADYASIRRDHPARKNATRHLLLNVAALVIFAGSAWLRRHAPDASPTPLLPLLGTAVGVAVLSYSGYLGGRIVYDDGIAVGRHRRRADLPADTVVVTGDERQLCVGEESALSGGRTLRTRVNGTVVTIACAGGKLHAFQEFCTHRFGPLSEGKIDGCEIMCPWHRSRFDLRTGKVTAGPAKEDLRTFHVEARDGKIWITAPKREK